MDHQPTCPQCGKFVRDVTAHPNKSTRQIRVIGICKQHGPVDISEYDWCWDDFKDEDEKDNELV